MPTTPTSMVNRLMGVEAFTDLLTLNGGLTVTGTVTLPSTTNISGDFRANNSVAIAAAATQLTLAAATHGGRDINLAPTAGLTITLPAATGSGVSYTLRLSAAVTGGNLVIDSKTNSANLFGIAFQNKDGTGITTTPSTATTNLITLNGSTTGGLAGDQIDIQDTATNVFTFQIFGKFAGTFGTPLSNH